jgi:hypothetical protein
MAKFANRNLDDEPAAPVERVAPKAMIAELAKIAPEPVVQPVVQPTPAPVPVPTPQPAPVPEFNFTVQAPTEKKEEEHWMKAMWRPAMGWLYMVICFMDFVAFPAIAMFMPILVKGMPYLAWQSLTLSNGGLIHMAFGAILGVAAYGRTQEKVASKQ